MYSIPSSDRLHALDRNADLGHTFWIPGGTQKEEGPVSSQISSMRRTCYPLLQSGTSTVLIRSPVLQARI